MDDKERLQALESVLEQMLKPIKGIPLYIIIKSLFGKNVFKVVPDESADKEMLSLLGKAIVSCGEALKVNPIRRPRPNEVGNDVEAYVYAALKAVGFDPRKPTSSKGKGQSTGYPDILFYDNYKRPTYLECKIFNQGTDPSTMRSFYLSPSESSKVSLDARHLLLAFGMEPSAIAGSRDSLYVPKSFKLVDLHDLLCDVKYEFNSDNRRLYAKDMVLLEGSI